MNCLSLASGATVPPAGGDGQPPGHRVVVERHHYPDVPVTDGPQCASLHPGGRHRSPAEHHGRERTGKMGQMLSPALLLFRESLVHSVKRKRTTQSYILTTLPYLDFYRSIEWVS